jgi:glycosyltransferase involved in cell wall biosynthesis
MPVVPVVKTKDITEYRKEDFIRFKKKIDELQPDIIHIYGTETWFQRQFAFMLNDLGLIDKTVVWIQGLVSFCANTYSNGLTCRQLKRKTLWELIRGTNIEGIQKRLAANGIGEIRELEILKKVFVRTEWDEACCKAINPNLKFYRCNETLRPSFYENIIWDIKKIERHSIFMSQYSTPIKGYHQMLKALSIIVREFPDTVLYTTGTDLLNPPTSLYGKLRESSYFRLLREEIIKRGLERNVRFLGTLMGDEMRDRYVKSHVFVSASSIENSPNSVGESMILGVPTVSSDVGGVSSMMTKDVEGLMYPYSEFALLAEDICRIFRSDEMANVISNNARRKACKTHNQEDNYKIMVNCYHDIID